MREWCKRSDFRDALPVQFSFYYDLRGDRNN